jgi:hypothetical protein
MKEIVSPQIMAEIREARMEYEAGEYVTLGVSSC